MSASSDLPSGWTEFDPEDHELSNDPDYQAARQAARQRREDRTEAYGHLLRNLRTSRHITQVALSEALDMMQSDISRLEHQKDLKVSTLAAYLQALGADEITLQVTFPDEEPLTVPLTPTT